MPPINIAMLKALLQNQMMQGGLQRPQINGIPKQLQQAIANKMVNLRQQRPIQESFPGQNIFQPPRMTGFPGRPQIPQNIGFPGRPQKPQQEGVPIDWAGILERSKPVTMTPSKGGEIKKPKTLYRGVMESGEGAGTSSLGKGLYSTPNKAFLKDYKFDKIITLTPEEAYPKNPLIINIKKESFEDWLLKESGEKNIREFNKKYDIAEFVGSKGYDGVVAGEEVVKYPTPSKGGEPSPQAERDLKKTYRRNKKILNHREGIGNHYDTRRP